MRTIEGHSGWNGKRAGRGVPRLLRVEVVGADVHLALAPLTTRTEYLSAVIPHKAFRAALRRRDERSIRGTSVAGRADRMVTVNRSPTDGPHDRGRLYLWIWDGRDESGGWDFLGPREEVVAEVGA